MAVAFQEIIGPDRAHGLVAGPRVGPSPLPERFEWFDAGHPHPNEASAAAGERALALARQAGDDRALVVLLSGGASALLVLPAPGVTVADKLATARGLMEAGIAIDGLNCVRKHLSGIKGGRLGAAARRSLTLAISDVHGPIADDPSVIGSGPTVADPSTYRDAVRVVDAAMKAAPELSLPASVLAHIERGLRGEVDESVKPGDARLRDAAYRVIGNRHTALAGARQAAERLGYTVDVIPEATSGEARLASAEFVAAAQRLCASRSGPACVIAAGEPTVHVTGRGRGGRNQEFALSAAVLVASLERAALVASAGTDGIDGPTDAAGAIVDRTTIERAVAAGLDWRAMLRDNDAYHFFEPLNDLIVWGPTGTNVGDLHLFLTG